MSKLEKYSVDVRQVLSYAREEAQRLRHRMIGPEHLLLGILKLHDPLIEGLFASLGITVPGVSQALDFVVGHGNKAILSETTLAPSTRSILNLAEEEAGRRHSEVVKVEHLFLALIAEPDGVTLGVLESFGISQEKARVQLTALVQGGYERLLLITQYHARYEATPTLNQVSRDLTLAALQDLLDPMIGREAELERTMQILSRRSKNNPVLIGPAGVGKTAIAEALALRIVQGRVPDHLLHARVVALDAGLLSVGTRFRGDLEERLKRILQEVLANPGIIIIIDELHTLAQTGVAEGSVDVANLFKPLLARGEFQCIGSTTLDGYRKTIEADPALERRFQPVLVEETNARATLAILQGLRQRYESFHHVTLSDAALEAAVTMSSRYIQDRCQPDKALDLLDEAASRVCVRRSVVSPEIQQMRDRIIMVQREKEYAISLCNFPTAAQLLRRERLLREDLWQAEHTWMLQQRQQCPLVSAQDIAEVVATWTGIPVVQISEDETQRLLNLEAELHRRVIGQHEAVQALAQAVRRSRANLRDPRRPIGSFIFVGPTGVGKTELARALAATLFGDQDALLKIDMSEFMESHTSSRLIGSPPGYVGYDQAGQLTEFVRRHPYCIVLFDEVEKAHPKVFDLLLQILEDGCLTDAQGRTVDFRQTMIILTSNVGTAHNIPSPLAFTSFQSEPERLASATRYRHEQITRALQATFRPELLNRLDATIVFHPLQPTHLREIVDLLLAQVRQRLTQQSIELQVSDAVCTLLVRQGYNAEYGTRPLRRTVQRLVEDPLAEALLRGTFSAGASVVLDVLDDTVSIRVATPVLPAAPDSTQPGPRAA